MRYPYMGCRSTATSAARRARDKFMFFATSRETATAVALVRVPCECRLRCWRSQLARRTTIFHRKREAYRLCSAIRKLSATGRSAARRARARKARVFCHLPRHSQRSGACAHATRIPAALLEVTARTSHHGLAPKERGLPPAQCHSIAQGPVVASAARRERAASSRVSPPPETKTNSVALARVHANAGCTLEATVRTSHHGLARMERGLPPVPYPVMVRRPITASATRRSPAASSRVLPPPERQPTQWRSRVGHAKAG